MHFEYKEEKFYPVTLQLARDQNLNSEYWGLMGEEFKRRAAITIQRAYYNYLTKKYKLNREEKAVQVDHPILEATSNQAQEHAKFIKQNKWLDLDFSDPYFQSNVHKAVRLNQISCAEMSTVLKLYWALHAFRDIPTNSPPTITLHRFFESGPYDIKSIPYASIHKIADFKKKLAALPENQQCYFNIPFSKYMEVGLIYFLLKKYESSTEHNIKLRKQHIIFLKEHINRTTNINLEYKNRLQKLLYKNFSKAGLISLRNIIKQKNNFSELDRKSFEFNESIRDQDTIQFLSNIVWVNEAIPMIAISPIDGSLSMIILSDSAFMALSRAMHGHHTTELYYTTGSFSLSLLYEQTKKGYRPTEVIHDDISSKKITHGYLINIFFHHWHDLLHTWRCSAIMHKDWIIYISKKLNTVKGFYMSKANYKLVDMDKNGHELRTVLEKIKNLGNINPNLKQNIEKIYLQFVWSIIGLAIHSKAITDDKEDHNLIILIDMIKNDKDWYDFFNPDSINKILAKFIPALDSKKPYYELLFSKTPQMQPILLKVKNLITDNPSKDILSLILTYRIEDSCFVDRVGNFLNHFSIYLEDLLKWHRNKGIYFTHSKKDLEKLTPPQIVNELSTAFSAYFEKNLQHPTRELQLAKTNMISGRYELCAYYMYCLAKYRASFHIKSVEIIAFKIESLTYFFLVLNCNKTKPKTIIWNSLSNSIINIKTPTSNRSSIFNQFLAHTNSGVNKDISQFSLFEPSSREVYSAAILSTI